MSEPDIHSRFDRAIAVMAGLGADVDANVEALVALGGELLGALGAAYVVADEAIDGTQRRVAVRWPDAARLPDDILLSSPALHRTLDGTAAGSGVLPTDEEAILVCAPVDAAGQRTGALCLVFDQPTRPSADDERLVVLVATAIAAEERRRRSEAELRESKDKYRELSEVGAEAIFLIENATGRLLEANTAATTLYGYSRDELLGMRNEDLSAEPDETRRVTRQTAPGAVVVPTRYHRRKDGSVFPVDIAGRFFRWKGRDVHVAAIRDATERHRFEDALEKRVFALTQPMGPDAAVEFDDLFNINELQKIQDAFADAAGVASIITRTDGTPITKPSNFCRLCRDIIRKTEVGLANCYRSDAVLGQHSPSGSRVQPCLSGGLWDAGAGITVGGRHVANWLIGQVRNEAQDEAAMLAYADEIGADREEFRGALAEVPVMSEERFARIADAVFLLANELSLKAYQNLQQARFIEERRRAEAERAQLQEQLQQAMKMEAVGRLAGGVAHDFNNLLTTIMGNVDLLLLDGAPTGPSRHSLGEIARAVDTAAALTRQILAFSRKQVIQPRVVDLNRLVADLSRMLRRVIGEDIALETSLGPDCGAVRVDPGQFEQILANLAVNARDAMPEGGALRIRTETMELDEARARVVALDPGAYVCLAVSDTGHGMDAEVLARIFEPFFTTKPRGRGTGLGLATTYGAVKQARGAITVESTPGHGTTFRILLPSEADAAADETPAPDAARRIVGGSETVLLVEDDEMVLEFARKLLERLGYDVHAASSGEDALAMAREYASPIHLLLTDVILPGMNGQQLAARLSPIHPETRVLYCSGYAEDVIVHRGEVDASVHFLAKPYSTREMAQAIRAALDPHGEA